MYTCIVVATVIAIAIIILVALKSYLNILRMFVTNMRKIMPNNTGIASQAQLSPQHEQSCSCLAQVSNDQQIVNSDKFWVSINSGPRDQGSKDPWGPYIFDILYFTMLFLY